MEVFPLSFFRPTRLEGSSGRVLGGLEVFVPEVEDMGSFFLVSTVSPVFFFTFSLLTFAPSVFPLTFTFLPFSFLLFSDWIFPNLFVVFPVAAALLVAVALAAVPVGALEELGGALEREGTSSIGSSRTGVASPLSIDWCDGSESSPFFFFLSFLALTVLLLVLDPEEAGG